MPERTKEEEERSSRRLCGVILGKPISMRVAMSL